MSEVFGWSRPFGTINSSRSNVIRNSSSRSDETTSPDAIKVFYSTSGFGISDGRCF
jgi:hypothetical protein